MSPMVLTIIILILAVVSFLLEKIPVNMTVMLTMIALVVLRIVDAKTAVSGFASTTILMLIGVVIVGSALFETGVCDMIAAQVTRFAKTERQMIVAILILASILSAGLSNSGTVAVFIPIIMGICTKTGFSHSKLLMSAFLGAMSGGRLTLVGDAAINVLIGDQIKELGTRPLRRAVELGEKFGLPVCVHTTDPPAPTDEVAAMLRPGDIYSHTYQGIGHHSAETDEVLKGMLAAQERGVLIEVGNGRVNFDFTVAEKCIEAGLLPDIISSDATPQTYHNGPAMWDLARVASKFLNMGMSLQDVMRAVTSTPARVLRMDHMIGTVAPGFEADLALFRMKDAPITFCDSAGNERIGAEGLMPVMTIRSGRVVWQQH